MEHTIAKSSSSASVEEELMCFIGPHMGLNANTAAELVSIEEEGTQVADSDSKGKQAIKWSEDWLITIVLTAAFVLVLVAIGVLTYPRIEDSQIVRFYRLASSQPAMRGIASAIRVVDSATVWLRSSTAFLFACLVILGAAISRAFNSIIDSARKYRNDWRRSAVYVGVLFFGLFFVTLFFAALAEYLFRAPLAP